MIPEEYVIWSTKMNAWWGQTGTYTTDLKGARHFTRERAVEFCKTRFNGQLDDGVTCVPVELKMMNEVAAK